MGKGKQNGEEVKQAFWNLSVWKEGGIRVHLTTTQYHNLFRLQAYPNICLQHVRRTRLVHLQEEHSRLVRHLVEDIRLVVVGILLPVHWHLTKGRRLGMCLGPRGCSK